MFTQFNFSNPYTLLLIPVAISAIIILGFKKKERSSFHKILFTTMRSIVIMLVILSLAGMSIRKFSRDTTSVFAVDISESMNEYGKTVAADFIKDSLTYRELSDFAGIVSFGANSVVEYSPQSTDFTVDLYGRIEGDTTNIAQALAFSRSLMKEDSKKRVTLISDGLENVDSAILAAQLLKKNGVTVDVFPVSYMPESEAQITSITVPKYLSLNVEYEIQADIYSVSENSGTLFVYKGNSLVLTKELTLRQGSNRVVFTDTPDIGGAVVYRAEIHLEKDAYHQNNIAYAYAYVEDIPKLLVIDYNGSSEEVVKILESSRVNVVKTSAYSAPDTPEGLSVYETVILCDTPILALPEAFPQALETYVRSIGGGVVVMGGENSYALGGYYKTPLETLLPVDMELIDKNNAPNLGMVVVTDRSGSMSGGSYGLSKISLAKEAVIRSVDALQDNDKYGVLAFDDGNTWIVPFSDVSGRQDEIKRNISGITEGGGTSILPALTEAYEAIKDADTKWKHIILLTDGEAEKTGYDALLKNMLNAGITLSCVAVGEGSDINLLKQLANEGRGRYYYTDAFTDLPQIFTKETFLAGKAYLNNIRFFPKSGTVNSILSGIEQIPALNGYITTTAKDRADVVLLSEEDEPVLASWQYGLGRSVAYTSALSGHWATEWLADINGVNLFKNAVSWTLRKQLFTDAQLTAEINGKNTAFTLAMPFDEDILRISGILINERAEEIPLLFKAIAPGVYKCETEKIDQGAYIVSLNVQKANEDENMLLGVGIPFSKEFDIRVFDTGFALLKSISQEGGGRVLTKPSEVFAALQSSAYKTTDISVLLLIFALVLFLVDVALRRFPIADWVLIRCSRIALKLKKLESITPKKDLIKTTNLQKDIIQNGVIQKDVIQKDMSQKDDNKVTSDTSTLLLQNKKKRTGR